MSPPGTIMDQRRKRLADLIKERSFRRGNFTLASGKQSAYYFDSKPTMLHPEGASLLAALIVDELAGVKADCVGGLEMGAVPLIAPVAMRSLEAGRPLLGFFVRKAPKDHGTRQRIEGLDLAGKTAVILEGAAEFYAAAGVPFKSLFRAEEFLRD